MGNATSATSRKSTATESYRKSTAHTNHNDLDEEFSDLILHQVKSEPIPSSTNTNNSTNNSTNYTYHNDNDDSAHAIQEEYPVPYNQFSNDLIEDEYNELNDGILDSDAQEVSRNILPNEGEDDDDDDDHNHNHKEDAMDVDETFNPSHRQHTHTPTPDLSKVDFTKITPVIDPSTNAANVEVKIDESYVHNNFNDSSIIPIQNLLIPVEIKWVNSTKEPINKISIIGSFSNWRDVIKLNNSTIHPNEYITTIKLPLGVHKLLYIINNEYRVSDQLPTATDQEGIFFNWFEVIDECHLFNHSLNQPNHIGASSDYDANIISRNIHHQQQQQQQQQQQPLSASMSAASSTSIVAGKSEVERINKKSTSFLTKISKEMSNFEHVEYAEDEDMKEVKLHEELQKHSQNYPYGPPPQEQQHHHHHLPPQPQPPQTISTSSVGDSSKYLPYESGLLTTSTSSLHIQHVKPPLEYSNDIPDMFVNYEFFKNKTNYELPEPPQLPAHLNNVLLNKISNSTNSQSNSNLPSTIPFQLPTVGQINNIHHHKRPPLRRADSSYYASNREASHLSIPNHVILNHLMTTSIRNDVLTVACITRYSGKFVTQIMHSPADK